MPTLTPSTPQPSKVIRGNFARLYYATALPAPGAPLTLNSDGSPDGTTSVSAFYVGMTRGGYKLASGFTTQERRSDELRTAYDRVINGETATAEFEALEYTNLANLAKLIPHATLVNPAPTAGAMISMGGLATFSSAPLIITFAQTADPTKFGAFMIYRAYNTSGLAIELDSTKDSGNPVKFEGLAVGGRPAGDQLCHLYLQT